MNLLSGLQSTTNFFSRKLTLKIAQAGSLINGVWTKAVPAYLDEEIIGDLQPLSSRELELLSEGERRKELIKLYTLRQIYISGQRVNTESDLIVDGTRVYKALKVYDRNATSGKYKVILEFLPHGVDA